MIRFYENASGFSETSEWHPRCWVNVIMPTTDDVAYLTEELCLPEDFLDDISDVDERPRLERNGKWMMAILRIPVYESGRDVPYFTVPIGVMLNGDYIVTVCNFRNALTDDFIEHTRKRGIVVRSSVDFILRLLNSSAYWFLRYLGNINSNMTRYEQALRASIRNEELLNLLNVQKSLVIFAASVKGNKMLVERLKRVRFDDIDTELLEDVQIEISQADSTIAIATNMLDRTLDTYASVISNNVNAIMKRLTSISIILMVPTLVASFYGMNVDVGIPMDNPWAFPVIICAALLVTILVCIWLRKVRWL
ncbi:MAG: magnesium transporter CorA family protein [Bacteroidales bacterium]|nr:magnesium transporter CorA family protein [Bacteroidales bacterium]